MIIKKNGQFIQTNNPSDSGPRAVSNALLIVVKKPEIEVTVNDLSISSANFSANIKNTNEHDIQSLFIKVNDSQYSLNNLVSVTGLRANTLYKYQLFYVDKLGHEINVPLQNDDFYTLKREINFMGLTIIETDDAYDFEVKYRDTDNASNLDSAKIIINNKEYYLENKILTVEKTDVPLIELVDLVYVVDYNNGASTYTIKNANSNIALTINHMLNSLNNIITTIYN